MITFFVDAAGDVVAKTERLAKIKSGATTLDSINEEENVRDAHVPK